MTVQVNIAIPLGNVGKGGVRMDEGDRRKKHSKCYRPEGISLELLPGFLSPTAAAKLERVSRSAEYEKRREETIE